MDKRWFGVCSALLLVLLSAALGLTQAPRDVTGTWGWTCCTGKGDLSGTIEITEQDQDGTFRGIFNGAHGGSVRGKVTGNTVVFTREGFDCCDDCKGKSYGKRQTWKGDFVRQSRGEEISGEWKGCHEEMHTHDFYLTRNTR
jgi:hypothetical protein